MKNTDTYSRIISGTMTWGKWGKKLSTNKIIALMEHCLQIGITTFDHADIYGDYTTEADFGKAFAESKIARKEVQFISKCGIQMVTGRPNPVKHYEYTKEYIIRSAEESLKKLKTEYLDLLLLHRPSPLMDPQEIAEAIEILKKDGKIRQFGVSNFTPSQIALLETAIPVDANQVEFSLTANDVMYDGALDDTMIKNRLAMSWSPLGIYFRENSKQTTRIRKVLHKLCEKYDAEEDQLLLAWILKHPSKIYPVVGTTTPIRLEMAVKSVDIEMELEDWFILLEASKGQEVP
ncbi:aldo/keto reductase [Maribacter sp. 2210JD10-5]|uniref:aldo/keto reductase n=1 Tax=Maribacter sp. 2210JD10-5 TaxID=3386272 RepID=UPI0039BCF71C